MIKNLFLAFLVAFTYTQCSLPNADQQIAVMDSYWKKYEQKQYDSLQSFYTSIGHTRESMYVFLGKLKEQDDRFGDASEVRLVKTSTSTTLTEKSVQLDYNIVYPHAIIAHHFLFKDNKIAEHWFDE